MKTRIDRPTWIVAISAVAAAAAYVTFVFLPQQRAIRKLADEVTAKQDYLARFGNLDAIIETTRHDLDKANAYNAAWHEHAPDGKELATMFGQISALAKAAGTTTTRFDPEPIVAYDEVRKIPVTVGCRGSFAQIRKFLGDLEGLPEAIWLNRVGLEEIPQDRRNTQVELDLVIFTDNPDNSDQVDHSG